MSIFNNNILAGAAAQSSGSAVHTIDQSIRFNDDDSAYMSRTPSSAGNRRTWTWSAWLKRGNITSTMQLFNAGANDSNNSRFQINSDDVISYVHADSGSVTDQIKTNMKIRDTAAWYNIQLVADTTNEVETERLRLYVNGQRISDLATTNYPTLNFDTDINNTEVHNIGRLFSNTQYLDGYLAEIVFIDGTALDPSSFGEYNSSNIWVPKDVSGLTFGTNGFHIDGRDSADLGDDESGNGNDFTTSGLASDDQKSDSPTSNHTTWNPLTTSAQAYSNGNLNSASSSSSWKGGLTTAQVPLNSGTWYYEIYVDSAGASSGQFSIGWSESNRSVSDDNSSGDTEGWVTYAINGNYYANGGTGSYGATYTTGDVIGCKIDTDSSTNNVEFYKNGASQGTISQAFNTGGTGFISPYILLYATRNATARFAQAEWTQTPSGITTSNAINTTNLGS